MNTPTPRVGQSLRAKQRAALARQGNDCHICGQRINYDLPSSHPMSFELDHVIPLSKGGSSRPENRAASHKACNRSKGARLDYHGTATASRRTPLPTRVRRSHVLVHPAELWQFAYEQGQINADELVERVAVANRVKNGTITREEYREAMIRLDDEWIE